MIKKSYSLIDIGNIRDSFTFILISLGLVLISGLLDDLLLTLQGLIDQSPLPDIYFPLFILIGLVLPLILNFFSAKVKINTQLISSYLLLLISQVSTEIIFVSYKGVACGIIVGFIYTSLRLIQLCQAWSRLKISLYSKLFIIIQMTLWSLNLGQIIINRFVPIIFL